MHRIGFLIVIAIGLASILKEVEPCGSSTSTSVTTTTISPSKLWYRCLAKGATAAVCKQGTCDPTDTFLTPYPGIANLTVCNTTKYYQQCYTYTKDTTGLGTCQADTVGCTGTNQVMLAEVLNDKTCTPYTETVSASFFRCVVKNGGAVTCRPQVAGCAPSTEEQVPFGIAYFTTTDCANSDGKLPVARRRRSANDVDFFDDVNVQ